MAYTAVDIVAGMIFRAAFAMGVCRTKNSVKHVGGSAWRQAVAKWVMISSWPTMRELEDMFRAWSKTQNVPAIIKFDTFRAGVGAEVREKDRDDSWVTRPLRCVGRNDLANKVEAIKCKYIPWCLAWFYRMRYRHD